MIATHTPGPWEIDIDVRPRMEWNNHIVDQNGYAICFMAHSDGKAPERDEANARLIAAAPDLIAALQVLLRDIEAVDAAGSFGTELQPGIYQANRAIDKATGSAS